ncbi:MAG: ATP-binding protein [Cypionkella sp.]|nr:ATP-binding protein [Cypionkella sp.]
MASLPLSTDGDRAIPLKSWLWRSYIGAALVPLLLIELSFLGIYWGTAEFVFQRGAGAVTELSTRALDDAAQRQAEVISTRLQTVSAMTGIYAEEVGRALATPAEVDEAEKARHAYSPDGVFYTTENTGGSAVFFSGVVPVGEAEKEKVWRTKRLDPIMKSIVNADPLIAQIYVNTHDSLNRIYPWFDVLEIYPPKMDIPSYNFYYEATPAYNPSGGPVWTDAYIDPAGSGWMVSSIAPVMSGEKVEAVVGIDITLDRILKQVLDIELAGDGYAMLVGRDGTILALPPEGEADLGLTELLDHSYETAILQDTFKPAEFNLFRREDLGTLALEMQRDPSGSMRAELTHPVIVAWATVAGTGWRLVAVASEESLLADSTNLRSQLTLVSQGMLAVLILFYLIFFAILWKRTARMSRVLAEPLTELEARMQQIAGGEAAPPARPAKVVELQRAHEHLQDMEERLAAAARAKAAFLSSMSHELRTPLTTISGYSELLRMSAGKPLDAERLSHVDRITRAGDDLLSLVEGVIDLASIEQGRVAQELAPVDLPAVAGKLKAELTPMAEAAEVQIDLEGLQDLPPLYSDARILSRVLRHLLSNAVKYNRRGGKVMLRAIPEAGGWLRLDVEDSGPGIPPEQRDRLFTAFDRLGQENSTISGAGVGLAISKRLITILGGTLALAPEARLGGTTLTIRLPTTTA